MRKVIVTCPCGQRMQVSRAAYGKIGICPKCNQKIRVGAGGVKQLSLPPPDAGPPPPPFHDAPRLESRVDLQFETTKRQFGQAVDLFYRRRYAESLEILDDLLKQMPGNAQIETARIRCIEALDRAESTPPAREPAPAPANTKPQPDPQPETEPPREPQHKPQPAQPVCSVSHAAEASAPAATGEAPAAEDLTVAAVHQAVLYLLREGSPDSVRLEAAELACRILGLPCTTSDGKEAGEKPVMFFKKTAPANGNGKNSVKTHAKPNPEPARTTTD